MGCKWDRCQDPQLKPASLFHLAPAAPGISLPGIQYAVSLRHPLSPTCQTVAPSPLRPQPLLRCCCLPTPVQMTQVHG